MKRRIALGRRAKYPSKQSINLLYQDKNIRETVFTLSLFAVFLVFLYFFTTLAVMRPLQMADEAEQRYEEESNELKALQEDNSIYAKVRAEYSHYGNAYLDESEIALQDRITMLNVIDKHIHSNGGIQSISLSDNVVLIVMQLDNADKLPEIIASLEASEFVEYVTATTAGTAAPYYGNSYGAPELPYPDYVNAQITVYFRTQERVKAMLDAGEEARDSALDAMPEAGSGREYLPEVTGTEAELPAASEAEETAVPERASGQSGKSSSPRKALESSDAAAQTSAAAGTGAGGGIETKPANVQTPSGESREIFSLEN